MDYYGSAPRTKIDKTDSRVAYKQAFALPLAEEDKNNPPDGCHNCRFYEWGACALVEGTIEANGTSKLWTKQPTMSIYMTDGAGRAFALHDLVATGRSWALFNEQDYSEAPEWIHYMPAPGVFNHPTYGDIVITEARNQRLYDNFKSGVYQEKLPVDVEHDLGLSGAVGWIDDMRVAGDGSVEAHVDWTSKGIELFEQDRFRYFSPAVMPEWPHTVTGETIPDVAIGGALTTHPYFKEKWLRPLVAHEAGGLTALPYRSKGEPHEALAGGTKMSDGTQIQNVDPVDGGTDPDPQNVVMLDRAEYDKLVIAAAAAATVVGTPPEGDDAAVASLAMSDREAQSFREIMHAGGPQAFRDLQGQVTKLEADRRTERFTQMVTGRAGGDDGAPWVGNPKDNVGMLLDLAEKFGETSERFIAYLTRERGLAQQQKSNKLFSEIGSGGTPINDSPFGRLKAATAQKMSEGAAKTEREAMELVAIEQPDLYEEYRSASIAGESNGREI